MNSRLRKCISMALVVATMVVSSPRAHAGGEWGIADAVGTRIFDSILRSIEGAMLGALKATAVQLLNSRVASLVGGTSVGNSGVITDYQAYLYQTPQKKAAVYMQDYFTQVTKGRASSSGYSSASSSASGSYSKYLVDTAKISLSSPYQWQTTFEEEASIEDLEAGDMGAYQAYFKSPLNNPFGFSLAAQSYQQSVLEQERQIAMVKAIAGRGFTGVEDASGNTLLPGDTVGQMVSNAQNIPNQIIAAASNPGELASGVILAFVNNSINKLFQKGLGDIQRNIASEIDRVDQKLYGQVNTLNNNLGPALQFTREIQQQLNVETRPASNPQAAVPQMIRI